MLKSHNCIYIIGVVSLLIQAGQQPVSVQVHRRSDVICNIKNYGSKAATVPEMLIGWTGVWTANLQKAGSQYWLGFYCITVESYCTLYVVYTNTYI
jgi:hypothetical protein